MSINEKIPEDKKLTVIFRIEAGCLGPQGESHVNNFCQFANKQFVETGANFINWHIEPRKNKTLAEMQFMLNNKNLTLEHADKYLNLFNTSLSDFEEQTNDKLSVLIDEFLGQ